MISLTPEQKRAVEHDGNIILSACPGSGKTRVIIAKLLQLAEQVEGSPRSIACITYTNAAVDEIEERVKQVGSNTLFERCEIATIHAFCLRFILRPYCWLVPELPSKFKILTNEMSLFGHLVQTVEDEIGRRIQPRTVDDYASIRIDVNGEPAGAGIDGGIVSAANAIRFWELMRYRGFIDFSMILYHSLQILQNHPYIAQGLSSRFAWLLVDEFQDTTDVQVAILRELNQHSQCSFFLVGDENQSINGFAGARPDLGHNFAIDIQAEENLALSHNFRCAPQVIQPAETLIPRHPPMQSAGEAENYTGSVVYHQVASAAEGIMRCFLPLLEEHQIPLGRAAILAPWWLHLVPVARHLRNHGIPVFGPGARPYQRKRLYASLAEQLGASAESDDFMHLLGVEKAIFRLVSEAMGQTRFDVFSYAGRCTALKLVYAAKQTADQYPNGMDWLEASADIVGQILSKDEWIDATTAQMLKNSVQEMWSDMTARNIDIENLQISDLGLFANPENAIKLITLHHSKGREFDAVAIIHANDGHIPHFTARNQAQFDEARRLFYVGITRAKKHLVVLSDQSDPRNKPSPYVAQSGLKRG
ncbi:ATP-dependent helicase [Thalassospira sp. A3_1]|uniref:ATP-dependent helicase n=1 Tax=Thalassospira sp. A3_1 TaxID=2821088 RepID=UPI001ADCC2D9|nr:ATP-dependent helicase [Thalassospira sp. A3_1]MBO9508299.1 ATP-dependent helicase [Thalassospira sp. A3_1]